MILVDGDLLIYQAAVASEKESDFGGDMWGFAMDMKEARQRFDADLCGVLSPLPEEGNSVVIAFSDIRNWRKVDFPEYKSNRAGKRKPCGYTALRDWVGEYYATVSFPYLEADDVLGILGTSSKGSIIASIDKDLATIPGLLFNWDKHSEPVLISEEEADYNHMVQTLTGDTSDGYPGCPGVGPKTAAKALSLFKGSASDMWEAVVATYEKKGLGELDAIRQACMSRICRNGDWDAKRREMTWMPPVMKS